MCHIVVPPAPLQHICQNEILLSAFASQFPLPLTSPPLSLSALLSAHNSINCPKLTVRQPFIYLSNPLCRRSLLLLLLLLLLCFIPLLLLQSFMERRLFRIPQIPFLPINHFTFLTVHTSCNRPLSLSLSQSLSYSPSSTCSLSMCISLHRFVRCRRHPVRRSFLSDSCKVCFAFHICAFSLSHSLSPLLTHSTLLTNHCLTVLVCVCVCACVSTQQQLSLDRLSATHSTLSIPPTRVVPSHSSPTPAWAIDEASKQNKSAHA